MKGVGRYLFGSKGLPINRMQQSAIMKEKWTGGITQRLVGHDKKWHDTRREKAMSWPKFLTAVTDPDSQSMISCKQTDFRDYDINGNQDKRSSGKNIYQSMGRLLEDPMECIGGHIVRGKAKQMLTGESGITEKSCGYRRAKGGLRDLIRLHEEEIARASGSQLIYAKRPKHDEFQQSTTMLIAEEEPRFDFDGCMQNSDQSSMQSTVTQELINTTLPETSFSQIKQPVTDGKNLIIQCVVDSMPFELHNSFETSPSSIIAAPIATADKSTQSEEDKTYTQEEFKQNLENKILEKEEMISKLLDEKETLVSKLEEQKKVANAYQKLEDRYRRRVYDLEKCMFACTCGALDSRSTSEQDLSKNFSARYEPRKFNSQVEMQQPRKVDNIVNEVENWMMDQKVTRPLHHNSSDFQDFVASESSLSSLSDVRLSNFPFEFIDQFDATSV